MLYILGKSKMTHTSLKHVKTSNEMSVRQNFIMQFILWSTATTYCNPTRALQVYVLLNVTGTATLVFANPASHITYCRYFDNKEHFQHTGLISITQV